MNRFLTKKIRKEAKGKKEEPKFQLDLSSALPTNDDFRTSLLLPNLSARFSMLREQDDPKSLLGKASDDSVLLPKRHSRLHEFGFVPSGLTDIAEVSSIHSSVKQRYTPGRKSSVDGYGTDDDSTNGSVMSRARPGEGNVLFGGRQKVYVGGRTLYDDDIVKSAWQRSRQQERPQGEDEKLDLEGDGSTKNTAYSPVLGGYNQRRETSSSTNSGPSSNTRFSTAATSIASQGGNSVTPTSPVSAATPAPLSIPSNVAPATTAPERSVNKSRRLYEQGLDQHIQDQQTSAMSRLNSIQQRNPNNFPSLPYLSQAKSATNLRGWRKGAESPTPSLHSPQGPYGGNFGRGPMPASSSPQLSSTQSPPMSPIGSDSEENAVLRSALQPNDRGKATAMGAFNKPHQFDETQYLQRLRLQQSAAPAQQQQQETNMGQSEFVNKDFLPSPLDSRPAHFLKTIESASVPASVPAAAPFPAPTPAPVSALPTPPDPLHASQPEEATPLSPFSVFQKAATQMRAATVEKPPGPSPVTSPQQPKSFFTSPTDSDADSDHQQSGPTALQKSPAPLSELDRRFAGMQKIAPLRTNPAPPIHDHPAMRGPGPVAPRFRMKEGGPAQVIVSPPERSPHRPSPTEPAPLDRDETGLSQDSSNLEQKSDSNNAESDPDSPTLGPTNGGLSGLVRQHLRNTSNVSSVYDEGMTGNQKATRYDEDMAKSGNSAEWVKPGHTSYTNSNPWDLEDLDSHYGEMDSVTSTSPVDLVRPRNATLGGGLNQQQNGNGKQAQTMQDKPAWEQELYKKHSRGASTETQQEREAFATEIAQRQRAIQESLKGKTDDGNTPSPASWRSMLRSKTSRDSININKSDGASNKAIRMLGLGGGSASASTTSLAGSSDRLYGSDHWRSEEERVGNPRGYGRPKPSRLPGVVGEPDARPSRDRSVDRAKEFLTKAISSPPSSARNSIRGRSSSERSSSRSRSRAGRYRNEGDMSPPDESSPNTQPMHTSQMAGRGLPTPVESGHQGSIAAVPQLPPQSRLRTNSKASAPGYFEQKGLHPPLAPHVTVNTSLVSPRLNTNLHSPAYGQPIGLPLSPRASPGLQTPSIPVARSPALPYSASSTPPVSVNSTPVTPYFSGPYPVMGQATRSAGSRKKSIQKSEISDPVLISSTSVVDTVDLPPGASLRNGMNEIAPPPPVPPINPLRRRFGLGRSEQNLHSEPTSQPTTPIEEKSRYRQRLRKTSSEGRSLNAKAKDQAPDSTPPMPHNNSPPRAIVDGAMF